MVRVLRLAADMSRDSPNPLQVAWSVLRAMRVRRPQPVGDGTATHDALADILGSLAGSGVPSLDRSAIHSYRTGLESVNPDSLSRDEALAFWLNLYNAGALDLAAEAAAEGATTVLRVPGGFSRHWATVAGEQLSLDDIEHGKIRRFQDPRIHGALVCGSASCPTLRYEPYQGGSLEEQLEDQMRAFLRGGGAQFQQATNQLLLSRVFLWYGSDFARPKRMPTWIPAGKKSIAKAVSRWLEPDLQREAASASVGFQSYDWGLSCSIG